MRFFDAHCHLNNPSGDSFAADETLRLAKITERAAAAGVNRIVCCGTNPAEGKNVLHWSEQFPQIIPMVGLHPWFVTSHWQDDFQVLEEMVRRFPAVGIGETGLDFQKRFINRTEQEASLAAHLDLASELNRPVAIHVVQAWGRLIEILRRHPAPAVLFHAFSGPAALIPGLVKLNGWFSFCGSVTNPRAIRVRAAVTAVPADRLLIETDSPDFPPLGCPAPNEPANLIQVARAVATLRGVSLDEISERTWDNASEIFSRS